VIAITCQHEKRRKNGTTKAGTTRYRCRQCGASWTESTAMLDGMKIGMDRAEKIIAMLCEGMSVSATARLTNTDAHTVIDLMVLVGNRCEKFMEEQIKGTHVDEVQCDEIWNFVFCKQKTAERKHYVGGCGSTYCYTAIERNSKLILAWHFGRRDLKHTMEFCRKLRDATTGKFHLSTDGFGAYPGAVRWYLGGRVDYGTVIKTFANTDADDERKYSPGRIIGTRRRRILGVPERARLTTSHSERMNGSIRTFVKRMGRLTYCFSKKWDNHRAAMALCFAHYNWCRSHRSLQGMSPAMAHGLTGHVWTVRELLEAVAST
jgi:IS1 family transposase/transposase-like protein